MLLLAIRRMLKMIVFGDMRIVTRIIINETLYLLHNYQPLVDNCFILVDIYISVQ